MGAARSMGPRPPTVQQEIETPISSALLAGKYRVGDVILVDCGEDGIELRPAQEPELLVELLAALWTSLSTRERTLGPASFHWSVSV